MLIEEVLESAFPLHQFLVAVRLRVYLETVSSLSLKYLLPYADGDEAFYRKKTFHHQLRVVVLGAGQCINQACNCHALSAEQFACPEYGPDDPLDADAIAVG